MHISFSHVVICTHLKCYITSNVCFIIYVLCANDSLVSKSFERWIVVTLTLGLRPRQGFARLQANREARESHLMFPGVQKSVKEWTLTLPFWELESQWTPKSSEGDCRGQNPLDWKIIYIIEKLLKLRCQKWVCMTHLDIWNTSYGQKKGRESNWQFNFRALKVENRPDFLVCRWCATCLGKFSTRATTLL